MFMCDRNVCVCKKQTVKYIKPKDTEQSQAVGETTCGQRD